MGNQQLNFVGPLAPIIGAIVGGLITLAATYFLMIKRRTLGFWVERSEDLTTSLRRHHQQIVVSVGHQGFFNLNRSTILVKNTGNVSLDNFKFDIEIPGEHKAYLHDVIANNADLAKSIAITMDQPPSTFNPTFHVGVGGFLNPGESFRVAVFFDDATVACKVRCRIADVRTRVREVEALAARASDRLRGEMFTLILATFIGSGLFSLFLFSAAVLIRYVGVDFLHLIVTLTSRLG